MSTPAFIELPFFGKLLVINAWKLVGFAGVGIFAARWLVQLAASHRAKRSTFPRMFWYMSLMGSVMLLSYFIFGKNDSVGILSNLFPASVATYNLFLDFRHARKEKSAAHIRLQPKEGALTDSLGFQSIPDTARGNDA